MYPVMLNIKNQDCLVVGGGAVALRKVEGLLCDGALVTVVSPEPDPHLKELAGKGEIVIEKREYVSGEAADYSLVFATTDDREVNREVYRDASGAGVWVNVADDPELCTFHLPSRLKRGSFQLAIASAGEAPFVVRRMRQMLERRFGEEWTAWIDAASRFRNCVREAGIDASVQEKCFDRFFSETVDQDNVRARVPTAEEQAQWLSATDRSRGVRPGALPDGPGAPTYGIETIPDDTRTGFVSLVGAGPGDPGLMTLKGMRRIMNADAVVYDRLAATSLPCDLSPGVGLFPVGKTAGHHPVPQEEINALLVRLGKEGKKVVRLKGGDPYVFGRGGEEAEALADAGIRFEVVPCATAAVAVTAYAGIPVTHRNEVVRVTMVTAHESSKENGPQVRWDLIAADPHACLLGYMGVTSLPQVTEKLLEAGMKPDTPAALIERGTTSAQKVVISSIRHLHEEGIRQGIKPPALFAVGPVVRHSEMLDWFSTRSLSGERIVALSPAEWIREDLEYFGAEVVEVTTPVTPAARIVLSALPLTGCIVRSTEEVEALDEEADTAGWGPEVIAWCRGPETAARAGKKGWRNIVELDSESFGENLIASMIAGRNS